MYKKTRHGAKLWYSSPMFNTQPGFIMTTTYRTTVTIWSRNGHTPITGRGAGYCDELVSAIVDCVDSDDALAQVAVIKSNTPHAYACHYKMDGYPNQNTRARFCHYG